MAQCIQRLSMEMDHNYRLCLPGGPMSLSEFEARTGFRITSVGYVSPVERWEGVVPYIIGYRRAVVLERVVEEGAAVISTEEARLLGNVKIIVEGGRHGAK